MTPHVRLLASSLFACALAACVAPQPDELITVAKDCLTCEPGGGGGGGGIDDPDTPPTGDDPPDTVWEPPPDRVGIDLLPIPSEGTFCARDKPGDLVVKIFNRGPDDSEESVTRVSFSMVGGVDLPTPPIPAGEHVVVRTPINDGCFAMNGGDCPFSIMADENLDIAEYVESNNYVLGLCVGLGK